MAAPMLKIQKSSRYYHRVQGPEDSLCAGPTISNGHWLITRPGKSYTGELFDKVQAKLCRLVLRRPDESFTYDDAGNVYGAEERSLPDFERVIPDGWETFVLADPNRLVARVDHNGLSRLGWERTIDDETEFRLFNPDYLLPFLARGCDVHLNEDLHGGSVVVCDGEFFAMLMPMVV